MHHPRHIRHYHCYRYLSFCYELYRHHRTTEYTRKEILNAVYSACEKTFYGKAVAISRVILTLTKWNVFSENKDNSTSAKIFSTVALVIICSQPALSSDRLTKRVLKRMASPSANRHHSRNSRLFWTVARIRPSFRDACKMFVSFRLLVPFPAKIGGRTS